MDFGIKDVFYLVGILITGVTSFLVTKHGLKDYIRDKVEGLTKDISDLRLENEKLKSKIDLQNSTVEQFQKQILDHLPSFYQAISDKKKG
jgi:hypothetical protein